LPLIDLAAVSGEIEHAPVEQRAAKPRGYFAETI
jgi:hypothetical protein